jgi:hypothetical protein
LLQAAEGHRYDPLIETAFVLCETGFWPIPLHPCIDFGNGRSYNGKRPIEKAWGAERHTLETFLRTYAGTRANDPNYLGPWSEPAGFPGDWTGPHRPGIGIGLGPGRAPGGQWLVDVEGDGEQAEASRAKLFGGAIATLGWTSARGAHNLLIVDPERMEALLGSIGHLDRGGYQSGVYKLPEFPGLELRIGGYKRDGTVKQLQSVCPPTVGTDGRPRRWTGGEP